MREGFSELKRRLEQLMPVSDLREIQEELSRLEANSVERSVYEKLARRWDRRKRLDVILAVAGILLGVVGIVASYWLAVREQRKTVEASHVNLPVIAMLVNEGKFSQARRLLDQALSIAPADPTLIQAKVHLDADEAVQKGPVPDGLTDYLEHYAKDHPADVKLRVRLAQLYYIRGLHDKALAAARTGLQLATAVRDETLAATAEHTMGMSLINLGKTQDAVRHLTHSSAVFCAIKDEVNCASSLLELARLSFAQRNFLSCLEYLKESETHDKSRRHQAAVSLLRGETHSALDQFDEAAESLKTALGDFESIGDERGIVYTSAVSAQVASYRGRCDEARRQIKEAQKRAQAGRMNELVLRTFGFSAEIEENCNDLPAAYAAHYQARLIAERLSMPSLVKYASEELARLRPKVPESLLAELEGSSRRVVDGLELKQR
jgi:tetratricopeptide (TPR) repeat protein